MSEEKSSPPAERPPPNRHSAVWLGFILKALQSTKAIKAALAAVAVSGWTILFSFEFALAITATLVFHEYGHLRAMRRFDIPTKGMYLIPFVGGIAVGEQAKTHLQDVYISLMGPVFGLAMSIAFYLLFFLTENHFVGLVASISALVNVFNLLPIHPLDGGRVVKALVFSGKSRIAFGIFFASSAVCFALALQFGLTLLCFFIVIGALDLLSEWRGIAFDTKPGLDRYGIVFSLAWYLLTVVIFIAVIFAIAATGLPGSTLATAILQS